MTKIQVMVRSSEMEVEFQITQSTTGKMLFEQVTTTFGIREVWFFGLFYTDTKSVPSWLKLDKKVTSQDIPKPYKLKFVPKFYPEDVSEFIQDVTVRHFYQHVRDQILTNEIYCPAETAVLLASYAVQVKYGDIDPSVHKEGFLLNDRLLPPRVTDQYRLSADEWERRVMIWWTDHESVVPEDAMLEYLKVAQDLEMYGVSYFEIKNKKGTQLYLGVDALGINIYEKHDKLNPKVGFPWSEVRNIAFNNKRFIIKPSDKKATDFIFIAPRLRINKRILALCMGNHELFMRRRRPDSMEVQQMKQAAKEEKMRREAQLQRYRREVVAREEAEKNQREMHERLHILQADMERTHLELEHAQATIMQLNQQLLELNEAKVELSQREREVLALNHQLESERQLSEDERRRLIDEIAQRELDIAEMRLDVSRKSSEADRLQKEVDAARVRQEEREALSRKLSDHTLREPNDDEDVEHIAVDLDDPEVAGPSHGIHSGDNLDRKTTVDQNVKMKQKLEELTKDLDQKRDDKAMTAFDVLHMENKRAGRDKYKTLRQIRGGNTKRRIDQYENM